MSARTTRRCHYCNRAAPEVRMTKDHVVPRYRIRALRLDGGHFLFGLNLVPACTDCNGIKAYVARVCGCPRCWRAWDTYVVVSRIARAQASPRRLKAAA